MDAAEFTDRFFAIEERLGLFADATYGEGWWDTVRYEVYWRTYRQTAGLVAPAPAAAGLTDRLRRLGQRWLLQLRLAARLRLKRHDVLIFRAARQTRNGRPFDAALDDLIPLCPGRHLVIDTHPHYHHRSLRPAVPPSCTTPPAPIVAALARQLQEVLGASDPAEQLCAFILAQRATWQAAHAAYRRLFARVRPRMVLMTQNGIEKALFCAARELGIPVVEAQHGLIGHAHAAYSYAPGIDYRTLTGFPERFLTFSSYWSQRCHYPAAASVALGNNHFHVPPPAPLAGPAAVMFVSADIYHATLLEWLLPLAAARPERSFIYKLHPNQQPAVESLRAELAGQPNIELVDGTVSAREMLTRVSHIVLVQSTVTHEALQAGRRVCIVPRLNYHVHHDLFNVEGVVLTPTLDDLLRAIDETPSTARPIRFFEPLDTGLASTLLSEVFHRTGGTFGAPASP